MQYLSIPVLIFFSVLNFQNSKLIKQNDNDFHIYFDSCKIIEAQKGASGLRIRAYFTFKNSGSKDIIIMKYSCEYGNVLSSINLLFHDSISSKIYSLRGNNIYDINPPYLLGTLRAENNEYYLIKSNQEIQESHEFQINLYDSINYKGSGADIVNISDINDVFKGSFRKFNIKLVLSNYPCPNLSKENLTYFSDFLIKPGNYYSDWIYLNKY